MRKDISVVHFLGPKDNYDGFFGLEYQTGERIYTIHLLPRSPFWGKQNTSNADFRSISYGAGPFLTFAATEYKKDGDLES